jgi:uncharacterized membrane protein
MGNETEVNDAQNIQEQPEKVAIPEQESGPYTPPGGDSQRSSSRQGEMNNTIAIISYLTLVGLVIAFVMNNEKKEAFARYHIRQSLGLNIASLALSIINVIPVLGWIVSIVGFFVLLYMWIVGLMNAINGKEKPVPILGKQFEEWFKSI